MLFNHVTRSRTGRDELRLQDGCYWYHKFLDRQVHCVFPVSVISYQRSDGIEYDVDPPGLLHDVVNVLVDRGVIEGVYHGGMCTTAICRDLLRHRFHVRLGPASEKNFCPFDRELFGDCGPNRASGAQHDAILSLQQICHCVSPCLWFLPSKRLTGTTPDMYLAALLRATRVLVPRRGLGP